MEIYTLRVSKSHAGVKFPFDRIYLVKYEDREYLRQLFRYALVMPVDGRLKSMLRKVVPTEFIDRKFDRDDNEKEQPEPSSDSWNALIDSAKWVMAVPILTKFITEAMPKYLVAARWYRLHRKPKREGEKRNTEPFPTMTYLQTPEKNIRPVCVMCPRMILHQNGECSLGDKICYSSLGLGANDYFQEGLNVPDAPGTTETTDVIVQEDDT